jgi:type IV pilus assembly protein PilP
MKNPRQDLSWTLAAGVVVLLSVVAALFLATGTVKSLRAQAPPAMDLPPPAADLPPPISEGPAQNQAGPGQSPNQQTPQNESPPAMDLPPPPSEMPAGQLSIEGAPGLSAPGLDASADPGLRMSNPEGFFYDPSGRRDPFVPPQSLMFVPTEAGSGITSGRPATEPVLRDQGPGVTPDLLANQDPLLSYYVRDFKLIGVLWDVNDPKAMVRGPNNGVYTVRLKMKMGRESAVIAAIREREIVLVQPDEKGDYGKGETLSIRMKN